MTMTIGADPELFVSDGKDIVSGIGFVGGSKDEPRPVPCGAVQEDNVLAEFNIDPCSTLKQFIGKISTVTTELDRILKPHGLHTVVKSSHTFERETLLAAGQKAMEFGCDPDFNCWTGGKNDSPNPYTELRTAGGHVHIGYDNPEEARSYEVACILDYLLGAPSVLLDDDTQRRAMYGQAGACRIKPYGVEYRVLSNFWLGSTELKTWIYKTTTLVEYLTLEDFKDIASPDEVRKCINESDHELAIKIVKGLTEKINGFYMP